MEDKYIEGFWSKMLVASKGINKIPTEYLAQAFNCRCTWAWIIPRKWKELLTNSTIWTNNKWWFVLNWMLYQITNSNIYRINLEDWTQTLIDSLWYNERTDILTYQFSKGSFTTMWNEVLSYSTPSDYTLFYAKYDAPNKRLLLLDSDQKLRQQVTFSNDNTGRPLPAVEVLSSWTTGYLWGWTWFNTWSSYILLDWQYASILVGSWSPSPQLNVNVWYYDSAEIAIIASEDRDLSIFDWESITTTVSESNSWIIEYARGYSFLASANILKISRPITVTNPEYAYDFSWTWSQQITYQTNITWLKATLNWIYIFTKDTVEFLWANSLQNVAWSATFISTPLWVGWEPVNNRAIAASWDQIFYMTKNRQINTVNYIWWTDKTSIWELSSQPVIWIDELLKTIDNNQPTAEAFFNQNDDTIQFHLRTNNYQFNNIALVYDMINKSWAVDTGKKYNYIVKDWPDYYWFSDLNSSIFKDDVWFSDDGVAIPFKIKTQAMNYWSIREKLFWWMLIAWWIWLLSELKIQVYVDKQSVFSDTIEGNRLFISSLWEVWWDSIWEEPVWWEQDYISELQPFEKIADEWRIYEMWTRVEVEISSISQIQDYIIDTLWLRVEYTNFTDIKNKF